MYFNNERCLRISLKDDACKVVYFHKIEEKALDKIFNEIKIKYKFNFN